MKGERQKEVVRSEERRKRGQEERKEGRSYRLPGAEAEVGGRHVDVVFFRVIRIRRRRRAVSGGRPERPTPGWTDGNTHTHTHTHTK